ncbi:hypothetical protein HCN51_57535 [Nonomuraea sp. FMUSA5-5]|uniref:Uncharacterized protein n=1 Tax=Nonomuraea composti TaxID=2720023 RepID=A0ABX1BMF6_9ACTN|nr:hypothetical protein [Nonomuraea sp. FMUSA5-5]NJP98921.1 hypothetical protein [Nonomuraea sp. FMUSA5-5]
MSYLPEIDRLPQRYYEPWLRSLVGDRTQVVIDAYRSERPDFTAAQVRIALNGDVGFRMPAVRMAAAPEFVGSDLANVRLPEAVQELRTSCARTGTPTNPW